MNQMPKKPSSVAREDFINNMVEIINSSELPAFVMEPIMKDLYLEVQAAMKSQYERDKEQYELACQEYFANEEQVVPVAAEIIDEEN